MSVNWSLILEYCGGQKTYSNPGNLEKAVTELFGVGIRQVYSDLCSPRFCCSKVTHFYGQDEIQEAERERQVYSWSVQLKCEETEQEIGHVHLEA